MPFNLGGTDYFPTQERVSVQDPSLLTSLDNASLNSNLSSSSQGSALFAPQDTGLISINAFQDIPQGTQQALLQQAIAQGSPEAQQIPKGELLQNKPPLDLWKDFNFWQKARIKALPPNQAKALSEYMYTQRITPLSLEFKKKHTEALKSGNFEVAEALEQEFAPYAARVPQFNSLLQQQADRRTKVYDQATENNFISDQILQNAPEGTPEYAVGLAIKGRATEFTPGTALALLEKTGSKAETVDGVTTLRDKFGRTLAQYYTPTATSVQDIAPAERDALTSAGIDLKQAAQLKTKLNIARENPNIQFNLQEIELMQRLDSALYGKDDAGLTQPQKNLAVGQGGPLQAIEKGFNRPEVRQEVGKFYGEVSNPKVAQRLPQGNTSKPARGLPQGKSKQRLTPRNVAIPEAEQSEYVSSDPSGTRSQAGQQALDGLQIYIQERSQQGASDEQIQRELIEQGRMLPDGTVVVEPNTRNIQSNASQSNVQSEPQQEVPLGTSPERPVELRGEAQELVNPLTEQEAVKERLRTQEQSIGRSEGDATKPGYQESNVGVRYNTKTGRAEIDTTSSQDVLAKNGYQVLKQANVQDIKEAVTAQNAVRDLMDAYNSKTIPKNQKEGAAKALLDLAVSGLKVPGWNDSPRFSLPPSILEPGQRELRNKAAIVKSNLSALLSKAPNADIARLKDTVYSAFSGKKSALEALQTIDEYIQQFIQGQGFSSETGTVKYKSKEEPKRRLKIIDIQGDFRK